MPAADPIFFTAPWGARVKAVTLIIALVSLGITASLWPVIKSQGPDSVHFWGALLPVIIVLLCAALSVIGYRLEGAEVVVVRRFSVKRFSLAGLQSVQPEPQLMENSRNILANSGFFGFMGLFKHPGVGAFRAYVTDPARLLLLRFDQLTLAVSPDDQERFVTALLASQPRAQRRPGELGGS